jgi:microcin C transport system ATP-binding protein
LFDQIRRTVDYVKAVDGINLSLLRGQNLGIVEESGLDSLELTPVILRLIASQNLIHFEGKRLNYLSRQEI